MQGWEAGVLDTAVIHKVKDDLIFGPEHTVCDPERPDAAGKWTSYALTGWYGFSRGHAWVFLVRRELVHTSV